MNDPVDVEVVPGLCDVVLAIGEDLRQLAFLHSTELTRETIGQLLAVSFPRNLGFTLQSSEAKEAQFVLAQGVEKLPSDLAPAVLDRLAADYCDIYCNYTFAASPCESVWIDDENLALQEPRFQVNKVLLAHGLCAADWRRMSEDHVVIELEFLSYLCTSGATVSVCREMATFLDEHLLRWLPMFAGRVGERAGTLFYSGLARFTAAYVEEFRCLLESVLGESRASADEIQRRMRPGPVVQIGAPKFIPGGEPSW